MRAEAPPRLRWWRELTYSAIFYGAYTAIRDTQGSAGGGAAARSAGLALRHANSVIRVERDLLVYHEQAIQHAFAGHVWFFQFWDVWYGTTHFVVTGAVIVWLFRRQPGRYPFWRNTLAILTALALIGFATFPLMPPRLLGDGSGFIDTLARYGGSWSFDSTAMQRVSNQFAAMPSLHIGWSTWCACALVPACQHRWSRALALAYPVVTLFCIVVTANHFFVDAAGGVAVLGGGAAFAGLIKRWHPRRRPQDLPQCEPGSGARPAPEDGADRLSRA